jgi:hypothetical protein
MSSGQGSQSAAVGAASGGRSDAAEPELKRRRLLDAGGPVEDDKTARQKMRDAKVYERRVVGTHWGGTKWRWKEGFDPDNVRDVKKLYRTNAKTIAITPMGYFAREGDLPMMRWLYVKGADTRDVDVPIFFPMWAAALHGSMEVCKWLFDHGAAKDVKRSNYYGNDPLSATFGSTVASRDLIRWLVLNGALCKDDDSGELGVDLMRDCLNQADGSAEERPELLKWAREHHQPRVAFHMFLMGTLSKSEYSATKLRDALMAKIDTSSAVDRILANIPSDQCRLLWDDLFPSRVCPLAAISGKSGILELIGDYVGIMRGREARIIRQLTELLPGVIEEIDRETDNDEFSSDDGDY